MERSVMVLAGIALILATALPVGCVDEKAELGEPCDLRSGEVGTNTVAVEQGNPDCASGICMSFLGNEFCTDECVTDADCPDNMDCLDLGAMGGSGSWCVLVTEGTDLEPSDPIAGSARYHAAEALAAVQAGWAADAHLVAVASVDVDVSGLLASEGAWRYQFLAPSLPESLAQIEVTAAGPGEISEHSYDPDFGPQDLDLLSGTYWRFDSHDVFALGAAYGAGEFMDAHPEAVADFTLSSGVLMDDDVALWTLSLLDIDAAEYWVEMFDAETGGKVALF